MDLEEAKEKVGGIIIINNLRDCRIGMICEENFGWVFLVEYTLRDGEIMLGGTGGYIVDKQRDIIEPISGWYIKEDVFEYQRKNNYHLEMRNEDIYYPKYNKPSFIKKNISWFSR